MNTTRLFCILIVLVPSIVGRADEGTISSATAPQFLVDARLIDIGESQFLVAARPYHEVVDQSYHLDSALRQLDNVDGGDLTERQVNAAFGRLLSQTTKVTILQSEMVRLNVRQLSLAKVDGTEASLDDLRTAIANGSAILLLPGNTVLHPAIASTFHPETLLISKALPGRDNVVARPLSR